MDNETQNQPVNQTPVISSTPQPALPAPKSKLPFILGELLLLFLVSGGAYYLGTQKNSEQTQIATTPSPTSAKQNNIDVSLTPIPTTVTDNRNSWKTYTGTSYTFMYPSDWKQSGPDEYLETVQLLNPNKTVSITISKGQYPYGFSGSSNITINPIAIKIDGKTLQTKENVSSKGAYVDFAVGEFHILYGTDYPAVGTQASLTDYNASKETIAEILSGFKLTQ